MKKPHHKVKATFYHRATRAIRIDIIDGVHILARCFLFESVLPHSELFHSVGIVAIVVIVGSIVFNIIKGA